MEFEILWTLSWFSPSWLDGQSFEVLRAWSFLNSDLFECTVEPLEAPREDSRKYLETQFRIYLSSGFSYQYTIELVVLSIDFFSVLLNWLQKQRHTLVLIKERGSHLNAIVALDATLIWSWDAVLAVLERGSHEMRRSHWMLSYRVSRWMRLKSERWVRHKSSSDWAWDTCCISRPLKGL